ncbi:hypothetical protein AYL99_11741 [Fonsecaea erecta]|uniref:Uncharacterized protein n=1 Tax=Fonsecaea erecta TaxID=1367422 RepID=A0A178Z3Z1_9EURO|nr:hypothetical protein AYL99_11741 [Fonsecaea erecta]OAP54206.1 hypothetical protein AYL99_11741 [Fonsecaea erecta]
MVWRSEIDLVDAFPYYWPSGKLLSMTDRLNSCIPALASNRMVSSKIHPCLSIWASTMDSSPDTTTAPDLYWSYGVQHQIDNAGGQFDDSERLTQFKLLLDERESTRE